MILNLDYFLFIYLFMSFVKIRKVSLQQGHMSKAIFD